MQHKSTHATQSLTKPGKQESILRQFRQFNRQLLTMHEYVSYKNTPSVRATKIFKNTKDIGIVYIWCCCLLSLRIARKMSKPQPLKCDLAAIVCSFLSSHPSSESRTKQISMFFELFQMFFEAFIVLRSINVLPNTTSVLTRDTMYRCCICFVVASKHCLKAGDGLKAQSPSLIV